MSWEFNHASSSSRIKQNALWKVYEKRESGNNNSFREIVKCDSCSQVAEYFEGKTFCSRCSVSFVATPDYAKQEPDLLTISHEVYYLTPPRRTINERRYPRIVCKNVQGCIRTAQGTQVIVDLINISRGGVCFSSNENFALNSPVQIATHYFEGGQNIFQEGRIIRIQRKPTISLPGEFAIQFSPSSIL